jgi:protein-tyrosine phosphatase
MADLSWITPDLAICGGVAVEDIEHVARDRHIEAIVELRAEACDGELFQRHGIELLHLPTADHCAIATPMLRVGVGFVRRHLEAGNQVLVHCHDGIGRSALLGLCVLVDRGFSPLAALALAKETRAVLSASPAQYEAWRTWLHGRGCPPPAFDAFAEIACRHARS